VLVVDDYRSDPSKLFSIAVANDGVAGTPDQIPLAGTVPLGCISVSPNGKYLAYVRPNTKQHWFLEVRVLGSGHTIRCPWMPEIRREAWPGGPNGRLVWSPDSSCVCELHPLPKPHIRRFSIKSERVDEIPLSADVRIDDPEKCDVLGFAGSDTLLVAPGGDYFEHSYPLLTLVEISLSRPSKVIRTYNPRVPEVNCYGRIVLSPRGDRLLWASLNINRVSSLQVRLHRYLPFVPGEDTAFERGSVSALDGKGLQEIGTYNIPLSKTPGPNSNEPWILDPKWTPDGKRIGFVYKDRLMTVPVD
jgi:hypothetical protein